MSFGCGVAEFTSAAASAVLFRSAVIRFVASAWKLAVPVSTPAMSPFADATSTICRCR